MKTQHPKGILSKTFSSWKKKEKKKIKREKEIRKTKNTF